MAFKTIYQTFSTLFDKTTSLISTGSDISGKRAFYPAVVATVYPRVPRRTRSRNDVLRKAIVMSVALMIAGFLFPEKVLATKIKVTAISVGSASGNATYGTASTGATAIKYTITLTESSAGGSQSNDAISVVWTGGTPTGVTTTFTPASGYNPASFTTITFTVSTTASTPAGSYTFTITNSDTNGGGTTTATGTLVVNKVTLTETGAVASNKVYDGTTVATVSGGSLSGVIGADVVSISTTGTFASANVGTGITVTIALTGASSGNYTLTQPGISANITAKSLTVTATGPSKPYGTVLVAGTTSSDFTASGTASSETVTSVTLTPDAVGLSATAAAGSTYVVTPSAATGSGGFLASNYNITYINFTGTVTMASLTITATGPSLSVGGVFTNGTYTNSSTPVYFVSSATAVSGETVTSVTLTASPTLDGTQALGTAYTITPSAAAGTGGFLASNYSITYVAYSDKISNNTYSWTGAGGDSNWTTDANWTATKSPATHPTSIDDVNIGVTSYSGQQPNISAGGTTTCSSLTFGSNGGGSVTLTVNSGNTLAITSGLTLNTGAATVSIINNGTVTISGGYTSNTGAVLNAASGSGSFTIGGAYNNIGTTSFGAGAVSVSGTYVNDGTTTFGAGAVTISGDYNNSGTNTFGAGNVTLSGAFTNSGSTTFNSASQLVFNASGPSSTFISTSISNPVTFYNVSFSGASGKYQIHTTGGHGTGTFNVASTGVITLSNSTTVNVTNATLLLLSDQNSSATVAALPADCIISGTVTVQRYLSAQRGYRLMASPVYAETVGSNNVYSLNYVINSAYITGYGGTAGGFDKLGNPTLYIYREDVPVSNVGFATGNYRAIDDITAAPDYTLHVDGGPYNIPVSDGYLFFFRGNRKDGTLAQETVTTWPATTATLSTSGTLNQGQVVFRDWYNPSSNLLGFSNSDVTVEGFNLAANPYASTIDWETYNTTTSTSGIYAPNVSSYVYELNPVTQNYDTYKAGSGGTIFTNNGNRYIASGQGFFVQAVTAAAQLTFNESAKTTTQVPSANLMMGTPLATVPRFLRIEMAKDSVIKTNTLLYFNDSAKPEYVFNEDAPQLPGFGKVSVGSLSSDNRVLSINQLPLSNGTSVRLNVGAKSGGDYMLNATELKGIPQLYDIWLVDAFVKDSLNLRTTSSYHFTITTDTNSFGSDRFRIIIRENPALAYKLLTFDAQRISKRAVQLTWTTKNEENYTNFTIERSNDQGKTYDVIGSLASTGAGSYGSVDPDPKKGDNLYRLRSEDFFGAITYSNVIDLQFQDNGNDKGANVTLFPNPAISTINLTIVPKSEVKTTYNVKISNSAGTVVKFATISDVTWQNDVSSLLTGTYLVEVTDSQNNTVIGQAKFVKL